MLNATVDSSSSDAGVKKGGGKKKLDPEDMTDLQGRKRFEAIQRLSARMRHRTGIVNNKEKNRLHLTYKQIERAGDILNVRVNRAQNQLKKELHDIEAGRRAYMSHPMSFHDRRRQIERKTLERYAARGRYLFAMRAEVRKQSDAIDAYNPRLEQAKKLVEPARRASLQAMERSQLLRVPTALNHTKPAAASTRRKIILPPIEVKKRTVQREMTSSTL